VRLLTMPETFQWYAGRVLNWDQGMVKLARPLMRAFVPATDAFESLPKFMAEVEELRATLTDPAISSYRLVMTPERMVLKEAQRAATYLALYGYPIDGAVLNRVLPENVEGAGFLKQLYDVQRSYRQQAHDLFAPLPIWEAPYEPRDLRGIDDLRRLGRALFGDDDPTRVFFRGATQELIKDGDEYRLRLPLPHVELNKVTMTKRGDQLADREATRAVFRNGVLEVRFGPPPPRPVVDEATVS